MEIETQNLDDAPPARMVAGALAHLARHMTTGCPRASELAALLLERVAADADADPHLREHARELVDILERERPIRRVPASRFADAAEQLAHGWRA
jgi:hypothetical protein